VEGVIAADDVGAAGGGAAELDRGLDRLGTGVAEKGLLQPRRVARQALCKQPGEKGDIELDEPRELSIQHLPERAHHGRVATADGEHAKAAQEIEIAVALGIEQVGSLAARVGDVEADRLEDAHELGIEMPVEELPGFKAALGDQRSKIEGHAWPHRRRRDRPPIMH
jgi:hypothetical protein